MSRQQTTDLIEITQTNAICIRDIISQGGVRRFHRHVIEAECSDEHPLAHAIRDVLPMVDPRDFSRMTDGVKVYQDFIRVQVRSGFVRVDDCTYVVEDGQVVVDEITARRVIYPGDDYSGEKVKVRKVCEIVHTQEAIDNYATIKAADAAAEAKRVDEQDAVLAQAAEEFKQAVADEVARQLA